MLKYCCKNYVDFGCFRLMIMSLELKDVAEREVFFSVDDECLVVEQLN